MTLTPEQTKAVSEWVSAGDSLSAIQKKLSEQFKISMTYMDVRFLVDDLNLALKDATPNAWVEAIVGIGGPILGTVGAVVCAAIGFATGQPLFLALAYTGFFLNLFNLTPIGFLDGGRIATAISPLLWIVGVVIMVALLFYRFHFIILLILILSIPRLALLFRRRSEVQDRYFEVTPAQRWTISLAYFGLAAFLALAMQTIPDLRGLR